MSFLPDRIGSPLSTSSLREDLDVSFDTVKRWLKYLEELYYHFSIKPYSKSISRSLKKEPKIYLFDWTEIEDKGPRFENVVASHLLKACHYWTDTGEGDFQLHYLRDKEKQEIDFVVTKDKKPWFTVECKYSDTKIDPKALKFQGQLKVPHFQLVYVPDVWRKLSPGVWVMSAEKFLQWLI
jgi:predicted AAA+ superfamily ATPase